MSGLTRSPSTSPGSSATASGSGGGADLAWPKATRTVRRRAGQPVTTDGPFIEGKELLGGVIIIEVDGWDTALAMAAEWPSLLQGPGAGVQVEAVTEH